MLNDGKSAEDAEVLGFLQSQISAFKKHLQSRYPSDERTKALLAKFKDVGLLPAKKHSGNVYNSGQFSHSTGKLLVAPRDGHGHVRSHASLNKTIVHELAHATRFKYIGESSHSEEWKSSWFWFLKIATDELHWDVEVSCSAVTFYGLDKKSCPGCRFERDPSSCGPFTGPPT